MSWCGWVFQYSAMGRIQLVLVASIRGVPWISPQLNGMVSPLMVTMWFLRMMTAYFRAIGQNRRCLESRQVHMEGRAAAGREYQGWEEAFRTIGLRWVLGKAQVRSILYLPQASSGARGSCRGVGAPENSLFSPVSWCTAAPDDSESYV